MVSKTEIKFINSLKIKKYRQKYGLFVVEGQTQVAEFLRSNNNLHNIYATSAWLSDNNKNLDESMVHEVSEKDLSKISSLSTPNQVLCVVKISKTSSAKLRLTKNSLLVLDDIRDPGNFGTILRIADWFDMSPVICSPTCVDAYNPKAVQASMGSLAWVKVWVQDLADLFDEHPAVPVYGTMLDGENIFDTPKLPHGFLLIGNEATGISEHLISRLKIRLSIPRYGKAESLNAAVAAAIFCAELKRK